MSQFLAIYGQRRRQVLIVLIAGALATVLCYLSTSLGTLPLYFNSMTATDGRMVYLVAQAPFAQPSTVAFTYASSKDGYNFTTPAPRSGIVVGGAAWKGYLYCLLKDGDRERRDRNNEEVSVIRLSSTPDNWTYVARPADWRPLGLATVDNQVTAFGQSKDRTKILSAALDNLTWTPLPDVDYKGDNITGLMGLRFKDADYLLWSESEQPAATLGAKGEAKASAAPSFVPMRIHLARATKTGMEMLPVRAFDAPVAFTAVGDDAGIHLFYRKALGHAGERIVWDPRLWTAVFADGTWGEPGELKLDDSFLARTEDFTAASIGGKTFIYTLDYWSGVLYAGVYGSELRGAELSKKFLLIPPSNDDVGRELDWAMMTLAAGFVVIAGCAGFLVLKKFPPTTGAGRPIYASVTDRAAAAVLDFFVIYSLLQLVMRDAGVGDFWGTVLVCYLVYGTMMESMSGGQTLGKKLLGLRVVCLDGGFVTFHTALRRNLFKFFEMLTVGLAVCLVTVRFQRPGDFLARTIVVKEFPVPREREE